MSRHSRRSNRQNTSKPQAPWQFWFAFVIIGPLFFWFGVDHLHLPGSSTNALLRPLDQQLHQPLLLLGAGWFVILIASLKSFLSWQHGKLRERLLDRQRDLDSIRSMSWQQFEQLVGECFKRQGYKVSETGQGGADGGVDLLLRRGSELILVQCKQWKTSSVGAPIVREMFGLMTHHRANRVKIVCCGHFTKEAFNFAQDKPIDLIGGTTLLRMIQEVQN